MRTFLAFPPQGFDQVVDHCGMADGHIRGFAQIGVEVVELRLFLPGIHFHACCRSARRLKACSTSCAGNARVAQQGRQQVQTVGPGAGGPLLPSQHRGERGQHIDLADQCGRHARLDPPRPASNKRHARAAFPNRILAAAQGPGGQVALEILDGIVLVAVISTGPLSLVRITSVLSVRLSRSSVASTSPTHQSNCTMASPRTPQPLLPTKRGLRHARHVDVVRGEVQEERLGPVCAR